MNLDDLLDPAGREAVRETYRNELARILGPKILPLRSPTINAPVFLRFNPMSDESPMATNTYRVPVSDLDPRATGLPCDVSADDGTSFATDLKTSDTIDVPPDVDVTLKVRATDGAGNFSPVVTKTFRSQPAPSAGDLTAPTIGDPVFVQFNP